MVSSEISSSDISEYTLYQLSYPISWHADPLPVAKFVFWSKKMLNVLKSMKNKFSDFSDLYFWGMVDVVLKLFRKLTKINYQKWPIFFCLKRCTMCNSFANVCKIYIIYIPTRDLQTPPLRSDHFYIKDAQCAETNEKSCIAYMML